MAFVESMNAPDYMEKGLQPKWLVIGLFWGVTVITESIRIGLGVVAPALMTLYHISPRAMGYILSGWNWGYTASLLFVGPVVDRFGPRIILGMGSAIWGTATLALPAATTAVSLFAMRALFGVGHSVRFPAQAAAIFEWIPLRERATAVGLCFSGAPVGSALGAMIAGSVSNLWGWQAVFYSIGALSLAFTVLWFLSYPKRKITATNSSADGRVPKQVPWSLLLRYRSVWGMALGQMGYVYAIFFFTTWLPGYLILERKMTVLRTGMISSLPFAMGLLGSIGGGWLGDHLIRRGLSRTGSRKGIILSGLMLATLMMVSAAFSKQTWLAVVLLTLSMGFIRITTASVNSTPIDLAPPDRAASLNSLQNCFGTAGGLLAPILTGYFVDSTGSFVGALVVAAGMTLLGGIAYAFVIKDFEMLPMNEGKVLA
ncbi:MAG: MFS transporter [Acidobacteria bacterium]|nr:MFS transporter [Acidobacteriota bacterium]